MGTCPGPVFMAPMAGVTDVAFRQRLRRNGCRLLYTEMVSAAALARGNRRTLSYLQVPDPGPDLGIQLFGADPEELAVAARMAVAAGFTRVDLNAGCPVKKVVRSGAGAALLRDPGQLGHCLEALRRVVPGEFSVKIRSGWDGSSLNFLQIGRLAQACGVDWVTLHARTRAQGYSGCADWEQIAALAAELAVPVVGNGDIDGAEQAVARMRAAGCAAVMIGRAALARPWIFRQTHQLLDGGEWVSDPLPSAVGVDLLRHLDDLLRWKGERVAVMELRKFIAWAAKGHPGAVQLRRSLQSLGEVETMRQVIGEFFGSAAAGVEAAT